MKGFVDVSSEFNKKRMKLLMPQLEELAQDLLNEEDEELREDLLETIHMPAQKEWTKNVKWLIKESTVSGSVRAGKEIEQLMKKFDDLGEVAFKNILPVQALDYIDAYSPIIAGVTDDTTKDAIKRQFRKSLSEGDNIKTIMGDLHDTVGLQFSNDRLENIARTESIKFYNAGRIQRYTDPELDDFIIAMQYDAIVDARTTDICQSLDGKIISINDRAQIAKFTPPNHFQCRATWLPISKYEDVDIDWDPNNPNQPQNGFDQTPDLFRGAPAAKKQAPKKDPTKMSIAQVRKLTDEEWANLDDEVFRSALKKVQDPEKKLKLSMTRAEKIFKERAGFTAGENRKPNLKAVHNRFGMSVFIEGSQKVVPIDDDRFAGQIAKLFNDGIAEGHIDLGDFIDSIAGAPNMRDIENMANSLNKLMKEGIQAEMRMDFLQGEGLADPKEIFGKIKLRQVGKDKAGASVVSARTKDIKLARKEAEQWISENFDPTVFSSDFRKRELIIDYSSNRSNAGKMSINMAGGRKIESQILVHEYMHTMTFNNQAAEDFCQEFFRMRTKGLKVGKINSAGEVGIADSFYNPYIGRVYEFDKNDPKGYEVMSMGAQAMFDDPEMFLKQDPGHFWFTYAVMNGLF